MNRLLITGIGSLPFKDVEKAIDIIFKFFREIPFWPQLPKRSSLEDMFIPFLSDLPFFSLRNGVLFIEKDKMGDLEGFYEDAEKGKLDRFSIAPHLVPGFYRLLERIGEIRDGVRFIKGQITGPFTCALSIRDERGIPVLYDPDIFDVIRKGLKMRALWMIEEIRRVCSDKEVILFFDEPYLAALDSYFGEEGKERIKEMFTDFLTGIPAIKGMHICGNTDWPFVFDLDLEIVNFDAFNFFDSLFSFENHIKGFYKKGGVISPGIVPSEPVINEVTFEDVVLIKDRFLSALSSLRVEIEEILLTPSCGLASLSEEEAEKALKILASLAGV